MKEPRPTRSEQGTGNTIASGAAAGFLVGVILAWAETLYLLFSVGPFFIGAAFFFRAVLLYGIVGAVLGAAGAGFIEILGRALRRGPLSAASYAAILCGAGLFAEIFFFLMDIYPYGGVNKYSPGTLVRVAAGFLISVGAAAVAYRFLKGRGVPRRAGVVRRAALAFLIVGLGLGSFLAVAQVRLNAEKKALQVKGPEAKGRPDVLLVVVDSLRADHFSGFGYPLPTSPRLDAMAARGVAFRSMRAASTWTVPTHASLLTGLYPSTHGAYSLLSIMDPALPTLTQTLSRSGYHSLCLYSNPLLGSTTGIKNGFDASLGVEHDQKTSLTLTRLYRKFISREEPSAEIASLAQAWASHCRKLGVPSLVFMSLMDVHAPYLPHEPYFSELAGPLDLKGVNVPLVKRLSDFSGLRRDRFELLAKLSPADLRYLSLLYDSGVRLADARLGALLDDLKARGLLARTVVAVTSDHGDFLGEHGLIGHVSDQLYDPILRVPFILYYPAGLAPRIIEEPVSQVDIFPTLLSVVGLESLRPAGLQGRDVLNEGAPPQVMTEFYDDVSRAFVRSLVAAPWKIIVRSGGSPELYDLGRDPGEKDDRAALEPDRVRELEGRLEAGLRAFPLRRPTLDDLKRKEMKELLHSLGYIEH